MNIRLSVLAITLLATALTSLSQETREILHDENIESPVISSDISNSKVNCIAEDRRGFIWIGTFRGLNRFNGYEYRQYYFTGEESSIPNNQVHCIMEDSLGRLWIGTSDGVCIYQDDDTFKTIPIRSSSYRVVQLFTDASGAVYLNNSTSVCKYDEDKEYFEEIIQGNESNIPSAFTPSTFITEDNELWCVDVNCIRKINLASCQVRDSIPTLYYPPYINHDAEGGHIFISYTGYTLTFDTVKGKFEPLPAFLNHPEFKNAAIKNIIHTKSGYYIINTEKHGLFVYDSNNDKLMAQGSNGFPFRAPQYRVNVMFEDSRGNIWIGYQDQGIEFISSRSALFTNAHISSLLGQKSVTSVACDRNRNLFMATLSDGLFMYNLDTGAFRSIDINALVGQPSDMKLDIQYLLVDKKNHLWMASTLDVSEFSIENGIIKRLNKHDIFMPMYICDAGENGIYVSSAFNYIVNLRNGERSEIRPFSRPGMSFIPCIESNGKGKVLAGAFSNNMSWIDTETGKCEDADIKQADWKQCIRTATFIPTDFLCDKEGNYWIGTVANGLLKYIPVKRTAMRIPGAPCSDICAIEDDAKGRLWISSMHGMSCYDPSSESFTNYYAENGIGGNQFCDRSSCKTPDGMIVFGGTHGITIFNPNNVSATEPMPIYFEDLKIDNKIVRPSRKGPVTKSLMELPQITLRWRENSFGITFAALEYHEEHSAQYSYRMKGYDKDWIEAGNRREAFYSRIPAGRYTFEVKLEGSGFSETAASIPVRVKTPVAFAWWMQLIYFIFIISTIIYISYTLRKRHKVAEALEAAEREKEQEKKIRQMNMRFFANISHEFRTPLTMISGPVSQLKESPGLRESDRNLLAIVQRNVRRMLRLVNQMLDFNKFENNMLKFKVANVDITSQLNYLADIFSVSAEEKNIRFVTRGLEDSLMVWADEDKVDKICWNILSNAFKFTSPGGKIEFSLDMVQGDGIDNGFAKISVKDTGPGIPEDKMQHIFERYFQIEHNLGEHTFGSGIGLNFAQGLAHMHHGEITVKNVTEGTGSEFSFIFPANESAYTEDEKAKKDSGRTPSFVQLSHKADSLKKAQLSDGKRYTALVVDDDVDVAYYLKELLSSEFKVVTRFDAETAYNAMREENPDIVLSDVVMRGKTGFELCRQIKEDLELSHIPVILLTAKADMNNQIEGLNTGADAYVSKPFDPEYLKALIYSMLRNREKVKKILNQSTQTDKIAEDAISPQDKAFMTSFYNLLEKELSNPEIDIQMMSEMLKMSRTKFYYKVKGLTGENPGTFFKRYKLNRAAELILEGKYTFSEIADMTGFSTPAHFSTSFKKEFGVAPSQYKK